MAEKLFQNNQVTIIGEIVSDFTYSHEVYAEKFYNFKLAVDRTSGFSDVLQIEISERLLDVNDDWKGQWIKIDGQFRSFNRHEETKTKLVLSVFVREIEVLNELYPQNDIFLDGYVCKQPVYRKTPLGREITDLLVAVNRGYGRSDYIPCICWGRNARFASTFEVGTHLKISGRIQSRYYFKKISETETEERVAYEVSINKIEV